MLIIVTGMVGVDKRSYLKKVCQFAEDKGKQIELCNVGDMMYAEAPDIASGKILDIPMKRLSSLRRSVFKDIIAKSAKVENLIVNTHATFRWRHGLFPAIDFDQMRQLNPDMYICIIDGVLALHHRLMTEHATEHTLKDLVVWREEEIICTEMLCKGIDEKKPFYCLARGVEQETVQAFYGLVFKEPSKKAYLSFPMTGISSTHTARETIAQFRRSMKEIFTCFDPGDLEEFFLPELAKNALQQGHSFIDVTENNQNIRLDADQVIQIECDINSQIYARDFFLIDQSDMIISFIPTDQNSRAVISSGVERELQHAHEAAKEVYVIWTAKQTPSVFVTQTATKVFSSLTEATEFFQNKIKE